MVKTTYNPFHLYPQEINKIISRDFHRPDYSKHIQIGAYFWKVEGCEKRLAPGSMIWQHHDQILRSKDGFSWELVVEQVCTNE